VEYVSEGQQRLPDQVTGAAAADLKPGRVLKRRSLSFTGGRPVDIVLVSLGDRFALDEILDGRRTARIDVPADFRPGEGRIVTFEVHAAADALELAIEYVRTDSARILRHFYGVFPREFEYVS
jgi:hypothetical protein